VKNILDTYTVVQQWSGHCMVQTNFLCYFRYFWMVCNKYQGYFCWKCQKSQKSTHPILNSFFGKMPRIDTILGPWTYRQCCESGSGSCGIRTFMFGSGSGSRRLGPDPDTRLLKLTNFKPLLCWKLLRATHFVLEKVCSQIVWIRNQIWTQPIWKVRSGSGQKASGWMAKIFYSLRAVLDIDQLFL
jgi:hypothetical protein